MNIEHLLCRGRCLLLVVSMVILAGGRDQAYAPVQEIEVPQAPVSSETSWDGGFAPAIGYDTTNPTQPFSSLQCTIAVTAPNGGEFWGIGSWQSITWTSVHASGNVQITLFTNLEVPPISQTIVSSTPDDGLYTWQVTASPSNTCKIEISDVQSFTCRDMSDGYFTIDSTCQILLSAPNGDEVFCPSDTTEIKWDSEHAGNFVRIAYSVDGGGDWQTIVSSTANDGSYLWTVPNSFSANCLVKVTDDSATACFDESDTTFTISQMHVTSPCGGATLCPGHVDSIMWQSQYGSGYVAIDYSIDGGSEWFPVTYSTPDDGSFIWTCPDTPSDNCLVRVYDVSTSGCADESGIFAICGEIEAAFIAVPTISHEDTCQVSFFADSSRCITTYQWMFGDGNTGYGPHPQHVYLCNGPFDVGLMVFGPCGSDTMIMEDFIICSCPCHITVSSPNGGETWMAGTMDTITWVFDSASDYVRIQYSIDNGASWDTVALHTENDGCFEWTVPGTLSEDCLVSVSDALDSNCCDVSDSSFTIYSVCDFAATRITVPHLVSVGYTSSIRLAITNLGIPDLSPGDAYLDIQSEGMVNTVLMDRLDEDPFFLFPAGESLNIYQYDWTPTLAGQYSIKAWLDFPCDIHSGNDTVTVQPVFVKEPGYGILGYFDPFIAQREVVRAEPGAGPAVRFTIPEGLTSVHLQTLTLEVDSGDVPVESVSFMVHMFRPGESDTTLGEELIEPFEAVPESVDAEGRIVINLTMRPDYENLVGLEGDFWVHLKATEKTEIGWVMRSPLLDTGVKRNWYYVWGSGKIRVRGARSLPAGMNPVNEAWEQMIGFTFSSCLQERGDANRDGTVNVLDVLAVVNHILGLVVIEDPETLCRADCTGDQQINVLDALGIVNVILGISECEH